MNQLNRRTFSSTLAMAGAATALPKPGNTSTHKRPNILMLLTDDQRWDTLGCMGNPVIQTPHLDSLAAQGVRFNNAFCTTSICMSSRANIFTGLYSASHGIVSFREPLPQDLFQAAYPTQLRSAGYYTGFVGKWGLGGPLPTEEFDRFDGFSGQGQFFHETENGTRHLTSIMGEQATSFIREAPEDKPLCLSVSFKAPHVQDSHPDQFLHDPQFDDLYAEETMPVSETSTPEFFEALPEFLQNTEGRNRWKKRFPNSEKQQESIRKYYRLITGVDLAIGEMLAALEAQGRLENTVVIFTSDNGFYLGERGLAGKWYMHEESIRVPMLVTDFRSRKAQVIDDMVLTIDVMPTILGLAGIEVPGFVQGRSLAPYLSGSTTTSRRREWFYDHHFEHPLIPRSEGIRTETWKYIRYFNEGEPYEELYSLNDDPLETTNLAGNPDHASTLQHMQDRHHVWKEYLSEWTMSDTYRWTDPPT